MKHPALNGSNQYRNFFLICFCRSHIFQLCQIITILTAYTMILTCTLVMNMYASVIFCFTSGPTSFPCMSPLQWRTHDTADSPGHAIKARTAERVLTSQVRLHGAWVCQYFCVIP